MKKIRKYNPHLIPYAQANRKDQTFGERKLWSKLRNRQLMGYKFRRQFAYKNFILDFYSFNLKLCIEIDGSTHENYKIDMDKKRDEILQKEGISTIRFTEADVLRNIQNVIETLATYIHKKGNQ